MRILEIRPSFEPGVLARFDVEITGDLRLYGLYLCENREGKIRVWSSNAGGRKAATFSPVMVARLIDAALAAYNAGGHRRAA